MANPLKSEIEAEIGGNARILRLDLNAMLELETFLGRSILDFGASFGYREAVAIIHFGLKGAGVDQNMKATIKLLDGMGIASLNAIASKTIRAAQPELRDQPGGNASAPGESALRPSPGAV